jgi:hypothetical protein
MDTQLFQITTASGATYQYEGTLEALARHLAAQPETSTYAVIED